MIDLVAGEGTAQLAERFDRSAADRARLFAVLEGRAPGRILVDHPANPGWVAVRSSWFGRGFFAGPLPADSLAEVIRSMREDGRVHLDRSDPLAPLFPPGGVEELPRLEFCRSLTGDACFDRVLARAPSGCELRRIDAQIFESCRWRSDLLSVFGAAERYLERSIGFGLVSGGHLVSEAHGFFWGNGLVEIGAITAPEERGQGHAAFVAAHLIATCEELGYTTYWGCDVSNRASASVAAKLGYGRPRPYSVLYYPAVVHP